jgi:hypothetical protein
MVGGSRRLQITAQLQLIDEGVLGPRTMSAGFFFASREGPPP